MCNRARASAWQRENRERYLARQREWAAANAELKRDGGRVYRDENREEIARRRRERWASQSPDEREARLEKARLRNATYRLRHPQRIAEKNRRYWGQVPKDAKRIQAQQWRAANPDKVAANNRLRRDGLVPDAAYVALLQRDPCSYCGGPAGEIEHIVALREGGDSSWENLAAACRSCNSRKNRRSLLVHLALRGVAVL